jgi:S-adenosyl-L-methionine hydrolase (adenosine-forming)
MSGSPVFVLSDFGLMDTYTAQMKGVILSFSGYDTPIVDLTSLVEPGNVLQGAFHLAAALPRLPVEAVILAVVDPGVGGPRRAICARNRERTIVCPDNGLLSLLTGQVSVALLPEPCEEASRTFHGRDVFAPAAARLAVDPNWFSFLTAVEDPVILRGWEPVFDGEGIRVTVLHTDRFGNCILSLPPDQARDIRFTEAVFAGGIHRLASVHFYSGSMDDSLLILQGSQGFMELAVKNGSAAERTGLVSGDRLLLRHMNGGSQ